MFSRPSVLKIENPKTIKLLSDEKAFSMLEPFSLEPCSLKAASKKLSTSISSYHYWIKRFLSFGLITIAFEKKRAGSNIKYYWMAADKLIINLHNKPKMLEDYYMRLLNMQNTVTVQSITSLVESLGLELVIDITPSTDVNLYSRLINNKENMQTSLRQEFSKIDAPAALAACRGLPLNFQDAKSLQKELWELLDKYQAKTIAGQKIYYLTTTLAPEKK